jgi:hypothetical protein
MVTIMDKDVVLRRLGWSDELIEALSAVSVDIDEPIDVGEVLPSIDIRDLEIGATSIDLSCAPVIASSVVPSPGFRRVR